LTADEAAEGLDVVSSKMLSMRWTTPFEARMSLVVMRAVELAAVTKIPDDCAVADVSERLQKGDRVVTHVGGKGQSATTGSRELHAIRYLRRVGDRATRENEISLFTRTTREIALLDDMVEQNLVNIGRSHRTELRVARKSRVDGGEDGDTLGLTEDTRQVRVYGFSGGDES
jgi:hypothetical protein